MRINIISTVFISCFLTACSTIPEPPEQIGQQKLSEYKNVSTLISEKFGSNYYTAYNDTSFLDLARPYEYAKAFCEVQDGVLNQVFIPYSQKNIKMPRVAFHLPNESELLVLNDVFGDFECVINEKLSWVVEIRHSGAEPSGFDRVYGTYITLKEYPVDDILMATKNSGNELPEYLINNEQDYNRATSSDDLKEFIKKNSNHSDLLGYVLSAQLKMPILLEHEETVRKKNHEIEMNRIIYFTKEIEIFRKALEVGDSSHCGLVVKVNNPVVQVQASVGLQWIKLEELYPAGTTTCSFYNGVYRNQRPSGIEI